MPYLGNEVAPLVQALEGKELKLDSDGDSSIQASTDDTVVFKTNGSTAQTIDSSGRVLTPSIPAFFAYLSSDQTMSIGSRDLVEFNATDFDTGSDYDNTTNYRFDAPVTGVYQFNSVLNPDYSSGSNTRVFAYFYKNGPAFASFAHETLYDNDRGQVAGSITMKLNANDNVAVYVYLDGGSASVLNGASLTSSAGAPSHFSGFLVG